MYERGFQGDLVLQDFVKHPFKKWHAGKGLKLLLKIQLEEVE